MDILAIILNVIIFLVILSTILTIKSNTTKQVDQNDKIIKLLDRLVGGAGTVLSDEEKARRFDQKMKK